MGGLGPGIGGSEWFIIGLVALLVVGPERLPGLLRQFGKMVAKARGMANEFRSSFDEMARQSELDDLRKEVEALRTGQGPLALGGSAGQALKDIKSEFDKPLFADTPQAASPGPAPQSPAPDEWPDGEPVMMPIAPPALVDIEQSTVQEAAKPARKTSPAKPASAKAAPKVTKTKAPAAKAAPAAAKTPAKPVNKAGSKAPRNSKLDL